MKKIQTCTNMDSNKLILGRMVKLGAPTEKLLISLLNEQNPHCYFHSTQVLHMFYFTMLPIAQFSAAKSVTLNNNNNNTL